MDLLKRFAKDKAAFIGLSLLGLLVLAAVFAPLLAPFPNDVFDFHIANRFQPPSATALFGTAGWAATSSAGCCSAPESR